MKMSSIRPLHDNDHPGKKELPFIGKIFETINEVFRNPIYERIADGWPGGMQRSGIKKKETASDGSAQNMFKSFLSATENMKICV